jgi:2-polyprenyl-3-methyl-5-hydroxy-6-metoxy-1,4-benzoquinol methylase
MNNKQTMEYWQAMASNNPNEKTTKVNPINDFTQIDAEFILKYADKNSEILDLASGTGLIINKFYDKIKHINAIERFEEFTKFIKKTPKIDIINQDITQFETNNQYDIITMFGIVQYFNETEIVDIYKKYYRFLKPKGKLIIKNQFGVEVDVEVSGFSQELQQNYYSQYRQLTKEQRLLEQSGYKMVEIIDIYPPQYNRWENTHFYAIVAEK